EEENDQLGSLEAFRVSSRQGYEEDPPEEIVTDLSRPKCSKKPRPSLSDRTIESLQHVPPTPKDRRTSSFFSDSPLRPLSAMSRHASNGGHVGGGESVNPPLSPSKTPKLTPGLNSAPKTQRSITSLASKVKEAKPVAKSPKTLSSRPIRPQISSKTQPSPTSPKKPAPLTKSTTAPKPHSTSEASFTKSSAALREQIAAARAARGKKQSVHETADPFNQAKPEDQVRNRIKSAWATGRLNISTMGLTTFPDAVLHMYNAKAMEEGGAVWSEVVDLTKLIAAGNELEAIPEDAFPDRPFDEEEDGPIFAGLEMLDLHSNRLSAIPAGLRRLEHLTYLNLMHNGLDNTCFSVITQITSLQELRLGNNNLSGNLSADLRNLSRLRILDVQSNRIQTLPDSLGDLSDLKVLNVSANQLTSIPMDALQRVPLTDLDASANALIASLFPLGAQGRHITLQNLMLQNNSLAALSFTSTPELPQIRTLDVTNNHLTSLPDVSGYHELTTLAAGENKIQDLPGGFTRLSKLRHVNLSGNVITSLDPEIGLMEALESLNLSANPLRERKFITMTTQALKRDLKNRLAPDEAGDIKEEEEEQEMQEVWLLKNGSLDLAAKGLENVDNELGKYLKIHDVTTLSLTSNKLTTIPISLSLGSGLRRLDLSHNPFLPNYLEGNLELPLLEELSLRACKLTSLEPLKHLNAPQLQTLDVTANALTGIVPAVRELFFTNITSFLAADNRYDTLPAEAMRGLTIVSLAGNELKRLPPELGLLSLKDLDVTRNPFRVPSYRILETGTEATLRWLRDRIEN
ncbi:L domain-like protein, partial [Piedraia hortae CBS 480.64]